MKRALNLRRLAGKGNPMARGVLLFAGLVIFTLLYALVLGWLSESGGNVAKQPAQPSVEHAPSSAQAPSVPHAPSAARAPSVEGAPSVAHAPAARNVATAQSFTSIDDSVVAANGVRFTYSGPWQHLAYMYDGRSNGTSSRTYRVGATAAFNFSGDRLKIYGVKGPNGGYAELRIDGQTYGLLRFYSPHKAAGALLYASPTLGAGPHAVLIVVAQAPQGLPKRRFVNLDGASYAGR